jgi:hypothetical protein
MENGLHAGIRLAGGPVKPAGRFHCAGGIERATINRLSHMAPRSQWDELLGVEASIRIGNFGVELGCDCLAALRSGTRYAGLLTMANRCTSSTGFV